MSTFGQLLISATLGNQRRLAFTYSAALRALVLSPSPKKKDQARNNPEEKANHDNKLRQAVISKPGFHGSCVATLQALSIPRLKHRSYWRRLVKHFTAMLAFDGFVLHFLSAVWAFLHSLPRLNSGALCHLPQYFSRTCEKSTALPVILPIGNDGPAFKGRTA